MPQTIDLRKKEEKVIANEPAQVAAPIQPVQPAPEAPAPTVIEVEEVPVATTLSWKTHVTPVPRKDRVHMVAGGLVLVAGLFAIFAHDFLFMTVLILSAGVLVLNAWREHRPSEITVHPTSIRVDDRNHLFADIKSFWIHYHPPHVKQLSLELKKGYQRMITLPLEDADPLEIRKTMVSYVPEKEHEQSLLDHIIRVIGL